MIAAPSMYTKKGAKKLLFIIYLKIIQIHSRIAISKHEFDVLYTSGIDRQDRERLPAIFTFHRTWTCG
jgi:hypothetical protein